MPPVSIAGKHSVALVPAQSGSSTPHASSNLARTAGSHTFW